MCVGGLRYSPRGVSRAGDDLIVVQEAAAGQVTWKTEPNDGPSLHARDSMVSHRKPASGVKTHTCLSPRRAGPDRRQSRSALIPCPTARERAAAHATGSHRRPERNQEQRATLALRSANASGREEAPGAGERGGGWAAEAVLSRQPRLPPQQDWGAERGRVCFPPCGNHCVTGVQGRPGRALALRRGHSVWRCPASTSFWNQERRNTDEQFCAPQGSPTPGRGTVLD